mmetsp:Transcript_36933/g.92799  ORF Transcript_36933/g.92799 Transcript_36933/m.92799 type:complete len:307 (-) Transcript_36933:746-1666(-)
MQPFHRNQVHFPYTDPVEIDLDPILYQGMQRGAHHVCKPHLVLVLQLAYNVLVIDSHLDRKLERDSDGFLIRFCRILNLILANAEVLAELLVQVEKDQGSFKVLSVADSEDNHRIFVKQQGRIGGRGEIPRFVSVPFLFLTKLDGRLIIFVWVSFQSCLVFVFEDFVVILLLLCFFTSRCNQVNCLLPAELSHLLEIFFEHPQYVAKELCVLRHVSRQEAHLLEVKPVVKEYGSRLLRDIFANLIQGFSHFAADRFLRHSYKEGNSLCLWPWKPNNFIDPLAFLIELQWALSFVPRGIRHILVPLM